MFPDGQCCVEAYFCISITVISCYLLLMLIYRRLADNSVWPVAALIGLCLRCSLQRDRNAAGIFRLFKGQCSHVAFYFRLKYEFVV